MHQHCVQQHTREYAVHYAAGVVYVVGQQRGGVYARLLHGLPAVVAVAQRYAHLGAQPARRTCHLVFCGGQKGDVKNASAAGMIKTRKAADLLCRALFRN